MVQLTKEQDRYLADFEWFERNGPAQKPTWVHDLRVAAIARFAALGFPTTRLEEWKYTNVAPLTKIPFTPAASIRNGLTRDRLGPIVLTDVAGTQLVFVNGQYAPELSFWRSLPPQGVQVGSLAAAFGGTAQWIEPHFARYASYQEHAFVALNTAFMEDGAIVFLPEGTLLERPLHLLFITIAGGEPTVAYPRNLLVAGPNSQATIIESYVGLGNGVYCTNAVTELVVGAHAAVDHTRLQLESSEAFHLGTLQIQQERSSAVVSHSVALGGALVRNDVNAVLAGEGSECTLNGLYIVTGQRHVDNHTRIEHVKAHCTSRELYKGVLNEKARGVFSGKIVVHPAAQKTDARQTNKNLLLSRDALIDSKPQLEIFNNDVQCSHGSTIGEIDEDALFYLRTRGIDAEAARWLLTYAFVSEILNKLKVESLRDQLEKPLVALIHAGNGREGV